MFGNISGNKPNIHERDWFKFDWQDLLKIDEVNADITLYKVFVRPYLNYGNILYDQAYNMSFYNKLESVQYKSCWTITGAQRGTSKKDI